MRTPHTPARLLLGLILLVNLGVGALPALAEPLAVPVLAPDDPRRAEALVLVDSASAAFSEFQQRLQPYLDHFGVPYTVADLAAADLPDEVGEYALVVLGQRGVAAALSVDEQAALSATVNAGAGLVSFDNAPNAAFLQALFGFGYEAATSGSGVVFGAAAHYITARHAAGEAIGTATMALAGIDQPGSATVLATTDGQPFLAVMSYGQGRAVQWGSTDWMSHAVLGPLFGLDDLVWRSLVWAARKPFVMQGLPPFVTMRMDDTFGPLAWVHIANEYGFKPWLGIFTNDIDAAEAADLAGLVNAGQATSSIHAFSTPDFFYFNHQGGQNWDDATLAANFAAATAWYAARGIPIGRYIVPHYYELGSNTLPGLAAWGVKYVSTVMNPGQLESQADWMPAGPFRLYETGRAYDREANIYYADFVPGTNEQLFNCITEIRDVTGYEWLGNGRTSVAAATADGTAWLTRALDSMAVADLFSHEYTFIPSMSMTDWRSVMAGITGAIADYQPQYVTRDYACQYARAMRTSSITASRYVEGSPTLTTTFTGRSDLETQYYVFTDQGGAVQQYLIAGVPVFDGTTEVSFTLPGPLDHLTLTPNPATVVAGAQQQFAAQGYDSANNPIPNLSYTWSVVNGGGTIDTQGRFTAGVTPGTYAGTVVASVGGVSGAATVEVTEAVLDHFTFSPVASPQHAGVPFQITLTASDAAGNAVVGFLGPVALSASAGGTLAPAQTGAFTNGAWTGLVQLSETAGAVTLSTVYQGYSGQSNAFAVQALRVCPCSIWDTTATPANPAVDDGVPLELGVKFRSDVPGYLTGLRFYKSADSTAQHTGHLWAADGTLLAEAVFTGESASGWQVVQFSPPVAIDAHTTYVASYFTPDGRFADTPDALHVAVDNAPLHALADGAAGPNGVFRTHTSGFPTETWTGHAPNYWVDVVFDTQVGPDTTPPAVVTVTPADAAVNVPIGAALNARFNEPVDEATLAGRFELRDDAHAPVAAALDYHAATRTATLTPDAPLAHSTTYQAVLLPGLADLNGNATLSTYTWSFTTAAAPAPPPDEGPGGPILLLTDASAANPFGRYYAEILRAEGFNAFFATDLANLTPALLTDYAVVLLAEAPLSAPQAATLLDWVNTGGTLITFRPDPDLAALLGLTDAGGTTPEGYVAINTATALGQGLPADTLQFHGAASHYAQLGTPLAALYSNATTATAYPAVGQLAHGDGQVVVWAYDLARSVVLTRQGNPAWAGQERDGLTDALRPMDLFVGQGGEANWLDTGKLPLAQADEQMRLLAHALEQLQDPQPRLWYFPGTARSVLIMTGDSEGCTGSCVDLPMQHAAAYGGHYTAYLLGTQPTAAEVAAWQAAGHEVAPHYNNTANAAQPSVASMTAVYDQMTAAHLAAYGTPPRTVRNHWILWTGWSEQAEIELAHGIQLDGNYYHYGSWMGTAPGHFTGSGLPLRFADENGQILDIFQSNTQLPDERWHGELETAFRTLVDDSLNGGAYAFLNANFHPPSYSTFQAQAANMMAYANAQGVPIWSAEDTLDFLLARNRVETRTIEWDGAHLTFTVVEPVLGQDLTLLVPAQASGAALTQVRVDGAVVSYTLSSIKGYDYALVPVSAGSYDASYAPDETPPVISAVTATPGPGGTANVTWTTDEPATSRVDYALDPDNLATGPSNVSLVTAHSLPLAGLAPSTTYYFRVASSDAAGNATLYPAAGEAPLSFSTAALLLQDTTAADFAAGTGNCYPAGDTLQLSPSLGAELDGTALPAGWTTVIWDSGGAASLANGQATLNAAMAYGPAPLTPGRSLEFVATFNAAQFQIGGFGGGAEPFNSGPWAVFGMGTNSDQLYARTWGVSASNVDTALGSGYLGSPHRYRIDWTESNIAFFIDGLLVHSTPVNLSEAMYVAFSDFQTAPAALALDWVRVTPYAPACTFTSRVFDPGQPVNWQALNWTADAPAATSVSFSYRLGNIPTPDGTWTPWMATTGPLAGNARYAQYQAHLATSDPAQTPVLHDVTFDYAAGSDSTPPTLTGRSPVPDATDVPHDATVVVTFSEPIDPATLTGSAFRLVAGALTVSASLTYGGHTATLTPDALLAPATVYTVRVAASVADLVGNPLGAETSWTFTTAPETLSFTDASASDFAAGDLGTCRPTGDALTLAPQLVETFAGADLPPGWSAAPWGVGGTASVSSGQLVVDGAVAGTSTAYEPGRALEFVATFGAAPFQHAGLVANLDFNGGWAMFSTNNSSSSLYARTTGGSDTLLSGNWLGAPHRYRIEWEPASVRFYIDGQLVHLQNVTVTGPLRPVFSDYTFGGAALSVDWLEQTPYATPCAFVSRSFDAGQNAAWTALASTGSTPAGTSLAFETRTSPDSLAWTDWAAVTGGAIASPEGRYAQYRATLDTASPLAAPQLASATLHATLRPAGPTMHVIDLAAGWNLVSFNLTPADPAPAAVLSSLGSAYDLVYAWNAAQQSWSRYDPAALPFANDLTALTPHQGFWVHLTEAAQLSVTGTAPAQSAVTLRSGWNLVGYPAAVSRPLPAALDFDFSLIYAYHAADSVDPWKLHDATAGPGYVPDLTHVEPGWGYWIAVAADQLWTIAFAQP